MGCFSVLMHDLLFRCIWCPLRSWNGHDCVRNRRDDHCACPPFSYERFKLLSCFIFTGQKIWIELSIPVIRNFFVYIYIQHPTCIVIIFDMVELQFVNLGSLLNSRFLVWTACFFIPQVLTTFWPWAKGGVGSLDNIATGGSRPCFAFGFSPGGWHVSENLIQVMIFLWNFSAANTRRIFFCFISQASRAAVRLRRSFYVCCFAVPYDDGGNLTTERRDGTSVAPRDVSFLSAYNNDMKHYSA